MSSSSRRADLALATTASFSGCSGADTASYRPQAILFLFSDQPHHCRDYLDLQPQCQPPAALLLLGRQPKHISLSLISPRADLAPLGLRHRRDRHRQPASFCVGHVRAPNPPSAFREEAVAPSLSSCFASAHQEFFLTRAVGRQRGVSSLLLSKTS